MNKLPLLLAVFLAGCHTVQVQPDTPCPPRPLLSPITPEEQRQIDPDVLDRIAGNQIELKAYAKKLEVRAGCEN